MMNMTPHEKIGYALMQLSIRIQKEKDSLAYTRESEDPWGLNRDSKSFLNVNLTLQRNKVGQEIFGTKGEFNLRK